MALISCPNCGKRITDRTEICPHCNAVLIKKDDTPIVSRDSIISNGKKRIPGVLIATVEALVFTRLLAVCSARFAIFILAKMASVHSVKEAEHFNLISLSF